MARPCCAALLRALIRHAAIARRLCAMPRRVTAIIHPPTAHVRDGECAEILPRLAPPPVAACQHAGPRPGGSHTAFQRRQGSPKPPRRHRLIRLPHQHATIRYQKIVAASHHYRQFRLEYGVMAITDAATFEKAQYHWSHRARHQLIYAAISGHRPVAVRHRASSMATISDRLLRPRSSVATNVITF